MTRRLVSGVLVTIIVASALAAFVVLGGQAAGKWRVAPVLSDSMAPSFGRGDMVVAEPIDAASLQPGDVLLFNAPIEGRPAVVHRIADRQLMDGEPVFHTKGDANAAPDTWTIRIRGERAWQVTHVLPNVGQAIAWLDNSALRMLILILGVGFVLLSCLRSIWVAAPIEWKARRGDRSRQRRRARRASRQIWALACASITVAAVLGMMGLAYAQFTATPLPPAPGFTSGALGTPTGLACSWTNATTLNLTWADATPTFTTGFNVRRSTTSGSGYSTIGTTVAPTVTFNNAPSPVTTRHYYVTQATHGWTSPDSNEAASNLCTRAINHVAGTSAGFSGDTGQATAAQLNNPQGLASDAAGNVYIADQTNNRIRRIDAATGIITTIAGGGASTGCTFAGAATAATLNLPQDVAVDAAGTVYIADTGNNCIRVVSGGNISLYAGNGATTACTFSGSPTAVSLSSPRGLDVDASGNLFIMDTTRRCVRKIVGGVISQVAGAGTGTASACTFAGAATAVILSTTASGVNVDASGNVYIADTGSNCIRRVTAGAVSQFAGGGANTACNFAGAATAVSLSGPTEVTIDSSGRVIISDNGRRCVRIVTAGNVSLLAGAGTSGSTGDNGPAIAALMVTPSALTANASGDVWIGDLGNDRVRRVEGPT